MNNPVTSKESFFTKEFLKSSKGIVKSFGLVLEYRDKPHIYLTVILLMKPTVDNIIGVLSLIFWSLVILVHIEYAWLAMSLGEKGEGGTIVLKELLSLSC